MTPHPVPRERIPWFPTIDGEMCTGCRACLEYCQHSVYAWNEDTSAVEVRLPYQCVVGCSGCEDKCAARAITFPDMFEVAEIIRKLRTGA